LTTVKSNFVLKNENKATAKTFWPTKIEMYYDTNDTPILGTAIIIKVIPELNIAIGLTCAHNFLRNEVLEGE